MRRHLRWITIAIVAVGGLTYYYVAVVVPQRVPDRTQILRLIAEVERSIEQARVSGLMQHISEDYEDSHGFNRRMIQRLAISGARSQRRLNLSVQVPEVDVHNDTATFVAEVAYTTGDRPVIPSEAQHLTVTGQLRRERGTWRVVSADGWQEGQRSFY